MEDGVFAFLDSIEHVEPSVHPTTPTSIATDTTPTSGFTPVLHSATLNTTSSVTAVIPAPKSDTMLYASDEEAYDPFDAPDAMDIQTKTRVVQIAHQMKESAAESSLSRPGARWGLRRERGW